MRCVARRLTGEPLAWITGSVSFCGLEIGVDPGVYVPRWQSEPLALRAAERLPANGVAIDVCTGAGAIAKTLMARHPGARVVATDLDARAVACARRNGVDARRGDLLEPLPRTLEGRVDVVVGVVPYVPTPDLRAAAARHADLRDRRCPTTAARTGPRSCGASWPTARGFLRRGGALLLELGGEQADALGDDLERPALRRRRRAPSMRRATSAASRRRSAPLRTETDLNRLYRAGTSLLTKGSP